MLWTDMRIKAVSTIQSYDAFLCVISETNDSYNEQHILMPKITRTTYVR